MSASSISNKRCRSICLRGYWYPMMGWFTWNGLWVRKRAGVWCWHLTWNSMILTKVRIRSSVQQKERLLNGDLVDDSSIESGVVRALDQMANPLTFTTKYSIEKDQPVLLFAMGDGNHSLATAKSIWEKKKARVGMNHPSRYALVEIENVHDEGLEFSPIHRVVFGLKQDIFTAMQGYYGAGDPYTA